MARAADRAYQLANGFRAAQIVHAAVELKIPDFVARGLMTVDALSEATGIERGRLLRLLRGLVALGVLKTVDGERFANTEVGELFREGTPGSLRPMSRMTIPESYRSWDRFDETLRTGSIAHVDVYGSTLWEHIARDPDFGARFNAAMAASSHDLARFVATAGRFDGASVVVDVGGGEGSLVAGVLLAHPELRGVVFDIPGGLTGTVPNLVRLGVADRCSAVTGDFFASVPEGDVYLLKDILHDWDDDRAAAILRICRASMRPQGRVMIVERVMPSHMTEDPAHLRAAMTDLQMMVQLGGQERTIDEFDVLFAGAGLRLDRHTPGDVFHLVEAVAL